MTILLCLTLLVSAPENTFLPQWMTPQEELRIDEIGKHYVPTAPPEGWVETPAEFEPVRGVFITWIYSQSSYRPIFREIVREVAQVSKCYIISTASDTINIKNYLATNGVPFDSIVFYVWPYNSIWIRDYGPWFVRNQNNTEGMVDFIYNRPRPADDTISRLIGRTWSIPVYNSPITHPGGNYMVDGLGTGFASNLIFSENSSYTQRQVDSLIRLYSGLDKFVVVPRINIEYTGHIDLWTKILNDTLIMVGEYAPGHSNHTLLNQNADSLSRVKNREGINYRIVRIPMPWSTSNAPPTYLNSLFVNNKVLVPTWGLPEDAAALALYQNILPGHQIVGINCAAMSGSGGAIHCITMQIPKSQFIHIKHRYLTDTNDTINPYRIRAQIISSSSLIPESCFIKYQVNSDTTVKILPFIAVTDTPGVFAGYIPAQNIGDTVQYYITVQNSQNMLRNSPNHAPLHSYTFCVKPEVFVAEPSSPYILSSFRIYPSPTNNRVNFIINIDRPGNVKIDIYNPAGQKVKTLIKGYLTNGQHNLQWNFRNEQDQKLSYGTYLYRIITEQETKLGKILYLR
ncbi:MAG: agmatine deiminase family protein [Candidatus Latescibacteria bacterium]|nr:agmatine deiminase family protein [Candidatus Latescibacterota bacterium]